MVLPCLAVFPVGSAIAQDWTSVSLETHSSYQAVDADGNSTWSGSFPIRMTGVVLNDNEDWLDPTSNYIPTDWPTTAFQMGGQAEIFFQATETGDFGGTASWMGQNLGNHRLNQDTSYSYTETEWYAELDRLGFYRPGSTLQASQLIRAGDLIEVRARGGLNYNGKMNVNEQHDNDRPVHDPFNPTTPPVPADGSGAHDFEIAILQKGYGLPTPTTLTLSSLKTSDDAFIFDETRQNGGEAYQSTLIQLEDVFLQSATWSAGERLTVTDGLGRTIEVELGYANGADWASFGTTWEALVGSNPFSIEGILNQDSGSGTDGYYLVLLAPDAFVPEPATTLFLTLGGLALLRRRQRNQ